MTAALPKLKTDSAKSLHALIEARTARIGIIGMGYVGQPLSVAATKAGFDVTGFDTDPGKVEKLNNGQGILKTVPSSVIKTMRENGLFRTTTDMRQLSSMDVIVICVPTPLNRNREPDLQFVETTAKVIGENARRGQLVSLESTTYPGTTREIVKPVLEKSGLTVGREVFLAFSPEREDPGNSSFHTGNIPKVVGADDSDSLGLAATFYSAVVETVVPVTNSATAEAVKLMENIFRSVNIALVNELKMIFGEMGIEIWEVIAAAKTKPFGYMPFYPGPGLGGHCIPIDPYYLSWKAREVGITTRFIELAGEINHYMPNYVMRKLIDALSERKRKSINGAKILLCGLAYKGNVDDLRESPSLVLLEMIEKQGGEVEYYDPFIPEIPKTREHSGLAGRRSVSWENLIEGGYDAVLISTAHDGVDYEKLVSTYDLVVDTRNATAAVTGDRRRIVNA